MNISGFPKCRLAWLILVDFIHFDLMFGNEKYRSVPMGLCQTHCQSESRGLKPLWQEYGSFPMDCNEI